MRRCKPPREYKQIFRIKQWNLFFAWIAYEDDDGGEKEEMNEWENNIQYENMKCLITTCMLKEEK